jgi:hypothetical protein
MQQFIERSRKEISSEAKSKKGTESSAKLSSGDRPIPKCPLKRTGAVANKSLKRFLYHIV